MPRRYRDKFDDDDEIPVINPMMTERIDFEKGMSLFPPVILAIAAFCIFAFVMEVNQNALDSEEKIIAIGAMNAKKVEKGEVWRLVSAMFLHGSLDHIIGNLIGLYILGLACEQGLGRAPTFMLFMIGGLCGSVASYFTGATSVGASGAVFALAGAAVSFFARHHHRYDVRNKEIGWAILVWAGVLMGMGFFNPMIDNGAHLGGFIGGVFLALPMKPKLGEYAEGIHAQPYIAAGWIFSLGILVGSLVFFLPRLLK